VTIAAVSRYPRAVRCRMLTAMVFTHVQLLKSFPGGPHPLGCVTLAPWGNLGEIEFGSNDLVVLGHVSLLTQETGWPCRVYPRKRRGHEGLTDRQGSALGAGAQEGSIHLARDQPKSYRWNWLIHILSKSEAQRVARGIISGGELRPKETAQLYEALPDRGARRTPSVPSHRRSPRGAAMIDMVEQKLLCHATEELLGGSLRGDEPSL